ncbi:ECF transporter S component [candidate division KSB1 bacterium]|nr:ECF transporter S component [candidate division KSB1 bacterium]
MQNRYRKITYFSVFFALTFIVQFIGFPPPYTGPLVNMMLFLTVSYLGIPSGILLGSLTPVIALWRGELPGNLAPMVPFIMLGNALLAAGYGLVLSKFKWLFSRENVFWTRVHESAAVLTGAFLKFIFFSFGVRFIIPYIVMDVNAQNKAVAIFSIFQLITAIAGGILALIIGNFLKRLKHTV